jgi:hypothetical protein
VRLMRIISMLDASKCDDTRFEVLTVIMFKIKSSGMLCHINW